MSIGKDKSITIGPRAVGWGKIHDLSKQDVRDGCTTHRCSRMPTLSFFDCIRSENSHTIDAKSL